MEAKRQVREAIATILVSWYGDHNVDGRMIDRILSLAYPNGQPMLAILAENQEMLQHFMLKAGWRKCL